MSFIAIGLCAATEPLVCFLELHEPMDVQFHCVIIKRLQLKIYLFFPIQVSSTQLKVKYRKITKCFLITDSNKCHQAYYSIKNTYIYFFKSFYFFYFYLCIVYGVEMVRKQIKLARFLNGVKKKKLEVASWAVH